MSLIYPEELKRVTLGRIALRGLGGCRIVCGFCCTDPCPDSARQQAKSQRGYPKTHLQDLSLAVYLGLNANSHIVRQGLIA